jgi:hypothetical protein
MDLNESLEFYAIVGRKNLQGMFINGVKQVAEPASARPIEARQAFTRV